MKNYIKPAFMLLVTCIAISACNKNKLITPQFDVSASAVNIKAGQSVVFNISGNPDFISFYSGEAGHKYANKDRLTLTGKPQLQFSTYAQNGGAQLNSLTILASTDFKGTYNIAGINSATWIDITSKSILSMGNDNVLSGLIDVSNVAPDNKPVYFAFKKHDINSPVSKPWGWTIRSFQLDYLSSTDNTTYNVTTLTNAGWTAIDVLNASYKWSISSTALTIGGGNINTAENEDWVVTKVLYPNQINADLGIGIKSVDARLSSYTYTFTKAGIYNVVFLASNNRASGVKDIMKSVNITVTN